MKCEVCGKDITNEAKHTIMLNQGTEEVQVCKECFWVEVDSKE